MLKYSRSQRWLGRLGNEGIALHVGVCMGGCASLGTWLQLQVVWRSRPPRALANGRLRQTKLQGLRGVGRGSSTCGTSSFTTDAAEKETKDMIDYDHAHTTSNANSALSVKIGVMNIINSNSGLIDAICALIGVNEYH